MADRPVTNYAANYIPGLQRAFTSANQALGYLREQGFGVRRQNFLHEWGAQMHEDSARPTHFTATLEQLPTMASVTRRTAPQARGFHFVIEHLIEDADSGELYWTFGGYRHDRLVSYGEAIAGAEEAFLAGQLADDRYPQGDLLGSRVAGVREYLPELTEPDDGTL